MYRVKPYVTAHYPLLVRGIFKLHRKLYRDPKRARILNAFLAATAPSLPARWDVPFSVHTLICHRDLTMGVCAAKALNLAFNCGLPWIFHDDGSLTGKDMHFLSAHFPGSRVVPRVEADVLAEQKLAAFPLLSKWRQYQCYLLKIPDVKHFATQSKILFMDTDVLFFKAPQVLEEALFSAKPITNAFNKDITTYYSVDKQTAKEISGKEIKERVNVGLWIMNKEDLDLQKVERWLAAFPENLPLLKKRLTEQTLLAMLATDSANGATHLPAAYDVAYEKKPEDAVCKHYVGKIRHGFELEGLRYLLEDLNFLNRWTKFTGARKTL